MYDAASTVIAQKLSQVAGVGQVQIGGSSLPAVRVEVNPQALHKYGIGFEDVRAALAGANANRPKGAVEDGARYWQIDANDQARTAADYLPLIVAYRNGAPVELTAVAEVVDSVQDLRNAGSSNGKPSVLVIISRQPNANIIETVDRVTELLPALSASIPGAIDLRVVMERTTTIRASLRDAGQTLALSVALVVLVVFLFLRNGRAALIPSVAVPVSLTATFGFMYLAGYSLDNLSLMALTIATGFVVDDAIVVLENVSRHVEGGMSPREAARVGAREVGFTVLAMTLSLIAVFIPMLLMGGFVGRFFREFAVTLSAAILVSLVVSLTTTPMMCARLLVPAAQRRASRFHQWSEHGFAAVLRGYERTLAWALDHGPLTALVLLATVALNVMLYVIVPKGFFPQQDTGQLTGRIQADQSISFQAMRDKLAAFIDIVRADPSVESVVGFTGGSQRNTGSLFVTLKPLAERGESADRIVARLRSAARPGARRRPRPQPGPGHTRRRPAEPRHVPVHDPGRRPRGSAGLGAAHPRVARAPARACRRQHRSAEQGALHLDRHRSRRRGAPRRDAEADRRHAERRVRATAGLDHPRAPQPVPRRDGGRTRIPAVVGSARPAARQRPRRRAGAVFAVRPPCADRDVARGQSPLAVRRLDDLLQPAGRRVAVAGDPGDRRRPRPHRSAQYGARQLPGLRARVPGRARDPAAPHSRRAAHACTSSWACSTRASSIRSPYCRRCRRRASGRWPR